MNPSSDPHNRFLGRLRQLLETAERGDLDLSGELVLFVVGLDNLPPKEAGTWLREVIRDRGRILLGGEQVVKASASVSPPVRREPLGVGPEEKSLLWGK